MPPPKRKFRNPELDVLRNSVEGPPDLRRIITELVEKSSQIHAGFLFDAEGKIPLQTLCQYLTATKNSYQYSGWKEFGIHLGLNSLQINCIQHNFNTQDPSELTLLAFVQCKHATLDKVIVALHKMDRMDIINESASQLLGLVDKVVRTNNTDSSSEAESDYFSLSEDGRSSHSDEDDSDANIIRPAFTPSVPLIFQDLGLLPEATTRIPMLSIQNESYQMAVPDTPTGPTSSAGYGCTALLTFASDGELVASHVAAVLRRVRPDKRRLGIVILNEHADLVHRDPQQFISSCFGQVDYIIPIITRGYLQAVMGGAQSRPEQHSSLTCIDPKYARLIHSMMSTDYLHRGCLNTRVRCVVPDGRVSLTRTHPAMAGPLFQVWVRVGEVDQLAGRLLAATI